MTSKIRFLISYPTRQLTDFEVYGTSIKISTFTPSDLKVLYTHDSSEWLHSIKRPDNNQALAAIAWFGYKAGLHHYSKHNWVKTDIRKRKNQFRALAEGTATNEEALLALEKLSDTNWLNAVVDLWEKVEESRG